MAKQKLQETITDSIFWSSPHLFYLLSDLNYQIIILYQNGSFGFGDLLVVDEFYEGMALFWNKKNNLNTLLVLALKAILADLTTNFGFVCGLMSLIKSCTKVSLYQNTVSEDIWSCCKSNVLHASMSSVCDVGCVKHNTKSYILALHLLKQCHCIVTALVVTLEILETQRRQTWFYAFPQQWSWE